MLSLSLFFYCENKPFSHLVFFKVAKNQLSRTYVKETYGSLFFRHY